MSQARLLFVDDDAALREVVRTQLTAQGYQLDEAADGLEAIEKLKEVNYDLMLLDINMPGKSGMDVLRYMQETGVKCRVIMLTGRVGFSIATETLKLGADEYITKPFSLDYLLESIKRVLAKQGA